MIEEKKEGDKVQAVINKLKITLDKPISRYSVAVKNNDTLTRKIYITLVKEGSVYDLENIQVVAIKAVKPDGHRIYNTCIIKDNEIIYDITNQTIAVPGTVQCELKLFGYDGESVTSARFTIEVYENLFEDGELESLDEFNIFGNRENSIIRRRLEEHINDSDKHIVSANEAWTGVINDIAGHESAITELSNTCTSLDGRITSIENELSGSMEIIEDINEIIGGQT